MVIVETELLFWMLGKTVFSVMALPLCSSWCVGVCVCVDGIHSILNTVSSSSVFLLKNWELCNVVILFIHRHAPKYVSIADLFFSFFFLITNVDKALTSKW